MRVKVSQIWELIEDIFWWGNFGLLDFHCFFYQILRKV